MIQLAWRFLMFQKDSALAQWFRARTENALGTRKTMIVALALSASFVPCKKAYRRLEFQPALRPPSPNTFLVSAYPFSSRVFIASGEKSLSSN